MDKAAVDQRIAEVVDELGLTDKATTRIGDLGKGMSQQVALGKTLFAQPRLLILDEPFSGMDPIVRHHVSQLLLRYNRKFGTTVFFSSHILGDVENMCDSIAILDKGELRAVGLKEELLGIDHIEVSGRNCDANGIMFLENMADRSSKSGDTFSVFLSPAKDADRFVQLFEKYGADNIVVEKKCQSLEKFFSSTVEHGGVIA